MYLNKIISLIKKHSTSAKCTALFDFSSKMLVSKIFKYFCRLLKNLTFLQKFIDIHKQFHYFNIKKLFLSLQPHHKNGNFCKK